MCPVGIWALVPSVSTTTFTNNAEMNTPDDTETDIPDDADTNDNRSPSPTPLNNDEEDDCGPVESGPLMNEVRFVSKKGKKPSYECCIDSNIIHSTYTRISHLARRPRSEDRPTRSR